MDRYGLRNKATGKTVGYRTRSNAGSDFCGDEQYILDPSGDKPWLVEDPKHAEYVRLHHTEWYNAGEPTPSHPENWKPDEWEVVKVVVTVELTPVEVSIPTMAEYLAIKYKKSDPGHYKHCMTMLAEGQDFIYTLYDLKMIHSED